MSFYNATHIGKKIHHKYKTHNIKGLTLLVRLISKDTISFPCHMFISNGGVFRGRQFVYIVVKYDHIGNVFITVLLDGR